MELSTTGMITASGTIVSGPAEVTAIGILGGADAATVKLRDNGSGGQIRWALGVAAATSDGISFVSPLRFKKDVYAEITGTTPSVFVAIVNPQANQV
jgi:hypothetical protein